MFFRCRGAFPVTGPIDVVRDGVTGVLDEDLARAAKAALSLDRNACRQQALEFTWQRATAQFTSHLVIARTGQDGADCIRVAADSEEVRQANPAIARV